MRETGTFFQKSFDLSPNELKFSLKNYINSNFNKSIHKILNYPRHISKIIYKLRLNTWNTKFSKDIKCLCNENVSVDHLLAHCPVLNNSFRSHNIFVNTEQPTNILYEPSALEIASIIFRSEISRLL
jgi:hypothetical protein